MHLNFAEIFNFLELFSDIGTTAIFIVSLIEFQLQHGPSALSLILRPWTIDLCSRGHRQRT